MTPGGGGEFGIRPDLRNRDVAKAASALHVWGEWRGAVVRAPRAGFEYVFSLQSSPALRRGAPERGWVLTREGAPSRSVRRPLARSRPLRLPQPAVGRRLPDALRSRGAPRARHDRRARVALRSLRAGRARPVACAISRKRRLVRPRASPHHEDIRDAIAHGAPSPVTPDEAVEVMEVLALATRSAREGRALALAPSAKVTRSAPSPTPR